MKIQVVADNLAKLAKTGATFVYGKGDNVALKMVRLTARDKVLTLQAYSGAVFANMHIGARVEVPGDILITPSHLTGLRCVDPQPWLQVDGTHLTVIDKGFSLQLPMMQTDVFPEVPWFEGEGCEVDAADLARHVKTLFPVLKMDGEAGDITGVVRVVFIKQGGAEGILFNGTDRNTVGATFVKCPVPAEMLEGQPTRVAVVPAISLRDVLDNLPKEGKVYVSLHGGGRALLQFSDKATRCFTLNLSEMKYPPLSEIESRLQFSRKVTFAVGPLAERLAGIRGVIRPKSDATNIFTFLPGAEGVAAPAAMRWNIADSESGLKGQGEFPIAYDGAEPVMLGIGYAYLTSVVDALSDLGVANAEILLGGSDVPAERLGGVPGTTHGIKIQPAGANDISFLVALKNIAIPVENAPAKGKGKSK